jgi:hypothetical protein
MSTAFVRFLMFFFIGVTATVAWESHGGAVKERIASWSPRLASLVPPAARPDDSPDHIVALSRDLAVVQQSVDKLATDLTKLRVPQQGAVRKPGSQTPATARAEPLILVRSARTR